MPCCNRQVLSMLADKRKAQYAQRNYFFDSPDGRVSRFRRTLRIRFFNDDKAVLTIKVPHRTLFSTVVASRTLAPDAASGRRMESVPSRLLSIYHCFSI